MEIRLSIFLDKRQTSDFYEILRKLQDQLNKYHIKDFYFKQFEGSLLLCFSDDFFRKNKKNNRNAGRKNKLVLEKNDYRALKYSDIILMQQSMTTADIIKKIGMKQATFYRHLKSMKESNYFKSLDSDKLSDPGYLKSIDGDKHF